MTELFLHIVNISISASWLVLAVLLARLVLKRAPKWAHVLLWGIVGVRLIFPFSLESALSLIPSAETISPTILTDGIHRVYTGFPTLNQSINPVLSQAATSTTDAAPNLLEIWLPVLAVLWFFGVAALLGWSAVSYLRLRRRVATAVRLEDNLYQSEAVLSPFVLGLVHPRMYLPFYLDQDTMEHVVAHERAHIQRRDHWWKLLAFVLLSVYWFNPLLWLAYLLLCRDIELACDEKVVRGMEPQQRADYSQALLACSVRRPAIAACPLAFGEVGVKQRVKSVLRYQRPTVLAVAASVVVCAIVGVCFLTNPPIPRGFPMQGHNVADLDPQEITEQIARIERLQDASTLNVNPDQFEVRLNADFQWVDTGTVRFFYWQNQQSYSAQLQLNLEDNTYTVTQPTTCPEQTTIYKLRDYLEALKYLPQEEIRRLAPDADQFSITHVAEGAPGGNHSITYTADGVGNINSWLIHLTVLPLYKTGDNEYTSTGDGFIHLFYGAQSAQILATYWGTDNPGQLQLQSPDTTYSYDAPCLQLLNDGTFIWTPSSYMSYIAQGYYEQTEDTLTLYTNDGALLYAYDKAGDTLIYHSGTTFQPLITQRPQLPST
ncbi:MAG TPA: hypothetical protein IAD31_00225 [Candidatus Enterenecus faecium]|uniref:Peptidase M56 domain-containing protein n=1 Tax=Candidatus Enterenecus faecium TaxID=2840780 RepID=A0A9D0YQ24_9FIRM|nr:hypothetical protein [Candidatus Enterenecus faecium]